MCPACFATVALTVAATASGGALTVSSRKRSVSRRAGRARRKTTEPAECPRCTPSPAMPEVVSRREWLIARKALLAKEKALTRQSMLSARCVGACRWWRSTRRTRSKVRTDGVADRPVRGAAAAVRSPLHVDRLDRLGLPPLHERDGHQFRSGQSDALPLARRFVRRDRPCAVAEARRAQTRKGWTFPLYSSFGSTFNYDFHVTLDESKLRRSNTTIEPRPSCSKPAFRLQC